ncbi:glycoside hydrolase family 16 protein [Micromonospora auratinigra]|uniref:Beta-glucanase, GH16 family n=1 Tax=Micromonospora auratinigra TaxID=261654 RepID=A0A1A8Z8H4_9ACTN|nr:glycoside hydrolase family 16 protein [Micromonospora auratinigra]SBT40255.1 Beta-glucanase, GH16 family [Micromonospora auratinigra]
MRSIRTIAALALAAVGLTTALTTVTSTPALAGPGAVTWSDDFTGAAGTAPDAGKWRYDTGGSGWGNNELQYYTSSTRNAALDGNGNLVITARKENPSGYGCWYGSCQYTSARLLTRGTFAQAYGRFEARIKIPRGQGLWPAFWMLGDDIGTNPWPNSGEIDIMENVGYEPSTVHGTIHGPGYSGAGGLGGAATLPGGQALADTFHTYAVDWAPDSITWYLDGVAYTRKTPADVGGNKWVFDHPFFLLLNVAVGGNWPGSPDGSTVFPQTMVIDYVRVQSWDTGGGSTGAPIVGYGGKCVDVASANTANGTPIQLWTCNGTGAQQWSWPADGSVRALGKCLDVAAGSTANGAKVQLYDCNGTGAQKWVFTAAGDIVNPQANKCLDATGVSSADGTRLQLWDCTGGANQKWRR